MTEQPLASYHPWLLMCCGQKCPAVELSPRDWHVLPKNWQYARQRTRESHSALLSLQGPTWSTLSMYRIMFLFLHFISNLTKQSDNIHSCMHQWVRPSTPTLEYRVVQRTSMRFASTLVIFAGSLVPEPQPSGSVWTRLPNKKKAGPQRAGPRDCYLDQR